MELHDIFPEVEIVEYSFYTFLGIVFLSLFVIVILFKYISPKKKKGLPYHLRLLEHSDMTYAKQSAYKMAFYGQKVVKTQSQQKQYTLLIERLTPYKYKKDTCVLPLDLQKEIKDFLQTIRRENV